LGAVAAVHRELSAKETLVTVVADGEDVAHVSRFVAEHELPYPVLLGDVAVLRRYRIGAFPTNYYLTPGGTVASRTVGVSTRAAMRARLWLAT
ncbi:MAG: TlpA family protein disulfide reductase, partial [Deltaproteobacteria bacterium]|nr:TlpA family protein disulfide reductase [Deltaproteobacteria bacterium]